MTERPFRIGDEGNTPRKAFRELPTLTYAAQVTAKENGSSLSRILRNAVHGYLIENGWDIMALSGGPMSVFAEWERVRGEAPTVKECKAMKIPTGPEPDPCGTIEAF